MGWSLPPPRWPGIGLGPRETGEEASKAGTQHTTVSFCFPALSNSLQPHGLWPARLLCPRDSPGKNTGVGAISSSRGSSWPRIEPPPLTFPALAAVLYHYCHLGSLSQTTRNQILCNYVNLFLRHLFSSYSSVCMSIPNSQSILPLPPLRSYNLWFIL